MTEEEYAHVLLKELFPGQWRENTRGYRIGGKLFWEWGERFTWPDLAAPDYGPKVFCYGLKYGTGSVGGITFMIGNVNIMLSGLAIAALAGIIMNAILPGKDYEFGTNQQGDTSVNFGPRHD